MSLFARKNGVPPEVLAEQALAVLVDTAVQTGYISGYTDANIEQELLADLEASNETTWQEMQAASVGTTSDQPEQWEAKFETHRWSESDCCNGACGGTFPLDARNDQSSANYYYEAPKVDLTSLVRAEIEEALGGAKLANAEAVDENFSALIGAFDGLSEAVKRDLKFLSDRTQESSGLAQASWDHMVGIEKRITSVAETISDIDINLHMQNAEIIERLDGIEALTGRIKATALKRVPVAK